MKREIFPVQFTASEVISIFWTRICPWQFIRQSVAEIPRIELLQTHKGFIPAKQLCGDDACWHLTAKDNECL